MLVGVVVTFVRLAPTTHVAVDGGPRHHGVVGREERRNGGRMCLGGALSDDQCQSVCMYQCLVWCQCCWFSLPGCLLAFACWLCLLALPVLPACPACLPTQCKVGSNQDALTRPQPPVDTQSPTILPRLAQTSARNTSPCAHLLGEHVRRLPQNISVVYRVLFLATKYGLWTLQGDLWCDPCRPPRRTSPTRQPCFRCCAWGQEGNYLVLVDSSLGCAEGQHSPL